MNEKTIISGVTFVAGATVAAAVVPVASVGAGLIISAASGAGAATAFHATDKWITNGGIGRLNQTLLGMGKRTLDMGYDMQKVQMDGNPHRQLQRLEMLVVNSFVENKIPVLPNRRVWVSPKLVTIGCKLAQADVSTINKAIKCQATIAMKTGDDRARVYTKDGYIMVELKSPRPYILKGETLSGKGLCVPIGKSTLNELVTVDFADPTSPHLALVGATGFGKSTTARNIAYHLAKQNHPDKLKFIVFAKKAKDWEAFKALPHLAAVVLEPMETIAAFDWLVTEANRRSTSGANKPELMIFIDDAAALLSSVNGVIEEHIEELSRQGRALGMHLIIGTQNWTNGASGGSDTKANMMARILFGATSSQKASVSAGRGGSGANMLDGQGDVLFINRRHEIPTAAAMVDDKDIYAMLPNGRPMPMPWQPWLESMADAPAYTIGKGGKITPQPQGDFEDFAEEESESGYMMLSPKRAPTRIEKAYIREVYGELGSINKVVMALYGSKNDRIWNYVKEAIGQ